MKQNVVAKITNSSRSYVSHINAGRINCNSSKAKKIKYLLEITDDDLLEYFFFNDNMLKVCDAAIQNCRKAEEKRFAVELLMAVENFREKRNGR